MWLHVLTIIFVVAKIFNYIEWSWWLVFAPSIVGVLLALLIMAGALALAVWANK